MDRGGCRLNGGGGGDMITLEDLESVSEEQLSDSPEEEEEEEEQQGRLLQYWRDVARGHQVEVPTGTNTTTAGRVSIHSRLTNYTDRSGRVSRQFNRHSPQQPGARLTRTYAVYVGGSETRCL